MKLRDFVIEMARLPHGGRMSRIAEMGRDARNAALWDEAERGNSYERRLAVQSCHGSRDSERARRMMSDPSRLVRARALRLAALLCDAPQLLRAWPDLDPKRRRRLLVRLAKHHRRDVLDAIIEARAAHGDELEPLLSLASPQVAQRLLRDSWKRASDNDWARLASAQPRIAIAQVLAQAQEQSAPDDALLKRANAVLLAASEREPDAALQLARELSRVFALSKIEWRALVRRRAEAVAQVALASTDRWDLPWGHVAHKLEAPTLLALAESERGALSPLQNVLKKLEPLQRAALHAKFGRGWRDKDGAIALQVLALLPRAIRSEEARRHLELPSLAATPALWLPYLALLPWEEALERARPFLGDPDPVVRAATHSPLAAALKFDRAHAGEWLSLIQARGNEQDPVRMSMLAGLAGLPPSLWQEEHLPALAKIQRQALDARDLSHATSAHLQNFAVSMLPSFPEWAAAQIAELVKERGQFAFCSLENRVNEAQMRVLAPRLEPIFAQWAQREHSPFLSGMRAFGKRLQAWDGGAKLLSGAAQSGRTWQQTQAASLLAEFRRDVWRELAPRLLRKDESWGTQPVMYNFVHLQRQDLLSPAMLGRAKPRGRFWTGKTRFVLPVDSGFWRWTPEQQAMYAVTLGEVATDTSRDSPGAFFAIDRLASLPDVEPATLIFLAQLGQAKEVPAAWREASLRVLSRLDGGQGVPTLLEALDDERARIAIYGLRRALMEMPPARALEIVRDVPLQKVTVAKEVVRLLGDIKDAGAFDVLLEFSARELHRDVRVALLRALWEHLENPRVWPILEEAAASEDAAISIMAARTTSPRLSPEARRRLNDLLARLLAHPDVRVRLQVLGNGALGALSDPEKRLLQPLFSCLDSEFPDEYQMAAQMVWATYAGREASLAGAAIEKLLPRRRALSSVISQFTTQVLYSSRHLDESARAVLEVLGRDALALNLYLELASAALDTREFAALMENLAARGALHADALSNASGHLKSWRFRPQALAALEEAWATSQHEEARRLALSALQAQAAAGEGWTDERRARLETLRHDASPLVASAAQWTFVPGEE